MRGGVVGANASNPMDSQRVSMPTNNSLFHPRSFWIFIIHFSANICLEENDGTSNLCSSVIDLCSATHSNQTSWPGISPSFSFWRHPEVWKSKIDGGSMIIVNDAVFLSVVIENRLRLILHWALDTQLRRNHNQNTLYWKQEAAFEYGDSILAN